MITQEDFNKIIKEMSTIKSKSEIVMYQGCSRGFIKRTSNDLNLCKDPLCKSCRDLEEVMKKELA